MKRLKEGSGFYIGTSLLAVFAFIMIVLGAIGLATATERIEGEVLGKEPRQQAFLGGTPDFLVVNGTGKVKVDAEMYHSYNVGDHFNETMPKATHGIGYDIMNLFDAMLPIMVIVVVLTIVSGLYWRANVW